MKLTEILHKLEREVAPVALSDAFCKKYGMYDNSGIIIDCGKDISGALFSLDLSSKAVAAAIEKGFNLIVTHHPAIYGGLSRINFNDPIAKCLKNGISVISMHLNFDAAPEGIDYFLMRGLGGEQAEISAPVDGGGYGRVYAVKEACFGEYFNMVRATFSERALAYGDKLKKIKKVASFCGAGFDDHNMAFTVSRGADVFVSSDLKHHEISGLLEKGINVIHLTHYSAENYGFNMIYNKIKERLQLPAEYFCDGDLK